MKKLICIAALAGTLSAQSFDGNGALEAFYVKPAHHSILKSKTFWVSVAVIAGSGALGGYMLSRGGHAAPVTPFQQPVMQQLGQIIPDVTGVNMIGIGGPGIPVVVVHK